MGVVKMHLPRFMYYRPWLISNANWRRNGFFGLCQIIVTANLLFTISGHWSWSSPRKGFQIKNPDAVYVKPIRLL